MNPKEMYDEFIDLLDVSDNFIPGASIWRKLHTANQALVRKLSSADPTYFIKTATISTVANQGTYALPVNARLGARIVFAEDDPNSTEIPPINIFKEHIDREAPSDSLNVNDWTFAIEGDKVRIAPVPQSSITDKIKVWYVPNFGNMLYGTASAGAASTITGWTAATNYTTNYGEIDPRDDYYNGMSIRIISGTGLGQTNIISDYAGATKVFTVETNWTTNPDATSVFAVDSPLPEDHRYVAVLNAALIGAVKTRRRMSELRAAYYGNMQQPGALGDLMDWLEQRQDAYIQTVTPLELGA